MDAIFLKLLHMGAAASWMILAVILLRPFLKNAPKWISCALWGAVAVRLLCPFSLETAFSLIPRIEIFPLADVGFSPGSAAKNGIPFAGGTPNPTGPGTFAAAPGAVARPMQFWISLAGMIWAAGLVLLLGFALFHFLRIRKKIREAVPFKDNIWICDAVKSPFILGIIRPKIFLSSSTAQSSMKYILAHEQAHLKRRDHWWKLLGYLLLSVYWFHPLVWAAYILFCRDTELACDEKVIKNWNLEDRKAYSKTLVACSAPRKLYMACPPAFGEIGIKARIKAILHYRKPGFWMVFAACTVCVLVTVCFLTNPKKDSVSRKNGISSVPIWAAPESSAPEKEPSTVSDPLSAKTETEKTDLDSAITAAILENSASGYSTAYDFACCDFVSLKTVTSPADAEDSRQTVTAYGWALYEEYIVSKDGITEISGSHLPIALTFNLEETGYRLKEYWRPREGSYYVPDIRAKFPPEIAEEGIDSQRYVYQQTQRCYDQAVAYSGLDTDAVIARLLDTLCSDPKTSSNPQDYLEAHVLEHRELLYYNTYTLRYCLNRFRQGTETGLEGKLMAVVCEELLQTKGATPVDAAAAETGQFWYDTLYAHGSNRVEPYLL